MIPAALQDRDPEAAARDRSSAEPSRPEKIRLRNISKHFATARGRIAALDTVDLTVGAGEFVTVIGPSGCGKSTLFNVLVGLTPPDEGGELFIEGKPQAIDHLLGRVAFMPQRDMLMPWRNVLDNAILAAEIDGVPRAEARSRAAAALDRFGLRGFEHHYPQQLSGGMRQRVALMRTFLFERDIMLLDEPFGALDALTRAMMQRWLLEVCRPRRVSGCLARVDDAVATLVGNGRSPNVRSCG